MVCKEEVCNWFKNLSPHKRIDYMCGMLEMCLPMELRFVGSYVEDLAKKDFNQLRESEGKANNRHELSKFRETDGRIFRTKMAIYLALLHSANRSCSNIIFQLLEKHVQVALTVNDTMDEMTVHNILLVLSMAMNHPAFSYHQKTRMFDYYKAASITADRILNKPEPELLILSESCELRSCDQHVSPMCSPTTMHLLPSPVTISQQQHLHSPVVQDKVHVCGIEVKTSRNRETEKKTLEYVIQVTWSNGEKKMVFKTYQELLEFHEKLQQVFPDELFSHQQAIKLPTIKGTQNHKKENRELLNSYAASLTDLPEHVLSSDVITWFFGSPAHKATSVEKADACTSPRPPLLADVQHFTNSGEDTVITPQYASHPASQTLYTSYIPHSPGHGDVCHLSPHSPVHHELAAYHSHSPQCSTKTTSPLISSPCHSPVSSLESLANSHPGSPSVIDKANTSQLAERKQKTRLRKSEATSQESRQRTRQDDEDGDRLQNVDDDLDSRYSIEDETGLQTVESTGSLSNYDENEVTSLLKDYEDLAPFADAFLGFNLIEAANLTQEMVADKCGAPRDVAINIQKAVEDGLREKQPPMLNGMIPPSVPQPMMWPMYNQSVPTPAMVQSMSCPPMPGYPPVFSYLPFQREHATALTRTRELSPTNSEYSSPSPSPRLPPPGVVRKPHLHLPTTDSSSDDGERDKRPGQYRGGKWKNHSAPNSARSSRQEKNIDLNTNTSVNSETASAGSDRMDVNVNNAGHKGILGNGYTSDPTFTRPPMLKSTSKAQPAHTNISMSHMVNMPDNSFKGGAQAFGPMMLPQHMRDGSMTSHHGHHGYMSGLDLGHRPMFYFSNAAPGYNRSHMNMNPVRPVFPPGVMTTSSAFNPTVITSHPSAVNGNAPVGGNGSKVFPPTPAAVPTPVQIPPVTSTQTASVVVNGLDSPMISSVPTPESCVHRSQVVPPPVVNTVASSTVTMTYTSCSPSVSTNRLTSCSVCGNTLHNQTPPTFQMMPQIHPGMWPGHYPNGLLQMHPVYIPNPYPNGFNQELLYNAHMYGVSHSNSQGSAVQNVIYNNGYNYNSHIPQPGSYSQKKKPKKLNCHNCGSCNHLASDCTEVSMEAMSGPNMLHYRPKNDSE